MLTIKYRDKLFDACNMQHDVGECGTSGRKVRALFLKNGPRGERSGRRASSGCAEVDSLSLSPVGCPSKIKACLETG